MPKPSSSLIGSLPSGRQGRILAVALLLLALVLVWLGVAAPLADLYDGRAQAIQARRAFADRMALVASQLPALRQRVAASAGTGATHQLAEDSDALAAAKLQDLLQRLAAAAGARFSSVETLPAEPTDNFRRIALKVSLESTLPVLIELMEGIEAAQPRLWIDDLDLHGSPLNRPDGPSALSAGFTVYGFRAAGAQGGGT